MRLRAFLALFVNLIVLASSSSPVCYWKSNNVITVEGSDTPWFACNNTQQVPGGAQLCCMHGAQCGEDLICHTSGSDGGSGWYVGGCTDETYLDPACRNACTGDLQTWIVYNYTDGLWHCCGDDGCTGTPTSETFNAAPPSLWSAVPSAETARSSTASPTTRPAAATVTVKEKPGMGSTGLSTGAKIGIGISAAIAGIAILASVALFVLWRRTKSSAGQQGERGSPYPGQPQVKGRSELAEDAGRRELASERI